MSWWKTKGSCQKKTLSLSDDPPRSPRHLAKMFFFACFPRAGRTLAAVTQVTLSKVLLCTCLFFLFSRFLSPAGPFPS